MENTFDTLDLKAEIFATQDLACFALALAYHLSGVEPEALDLVKEAFIARHQTIADELTRELPVTEKYARYCIAYEKAIETGFALTKRYLDDLPHTRD